MVCHTPHIDMRDGSLSYERFCVEAQLLQKKSHEVATRGEEVATWEWRHGSRQHLDGDSYLVSTENVRVLDAREVHGKELSGDIDELLAEEDVLTEDVGTTLETTATKTALLEFHIVYHTIYQTPALYFRALAVDGTPLPATAVTRDVHFPGSNGRSAFVAMENHPVLGNPFSFLHPCETAAAMQLLQGQVQSTSSCEVPQYLASWLSLVQPLTGISPHDYFCSQRQGGVASEASATAANTPAKFAFGSRLPSTGNKSLLRGVKSSGRPRVHVSTRVRTEHDVRAAGVNRKRRRSNSDETKPPLAVKTTLPLLGSQLPAPTKVAALLGSHHAIPPSNPAMRGKKQRSEQLAVELAATEPDFWIKRRQVVEAALKELDSLEKRIMTISE